MCNTYLEVELDNGTLLNINREQPEPIFDILGNKWSVIIWYLLLILIGKLLSGVTKGLV